MKLDETGLRQLLDASDRGLALMDADDIVAEIDQDYQLESYSPKLFQFG